LPALAADRWVLGLLILPPNLLGFGELPPPLTPDSIVQRYQLSPIYDRLIYG
jgi:hypothetical protein